MQDDLLKGRSLLYVVLWFLSYVAYVSSLSMVLKLFNCNIKKVSLENYGELFFYQFNEKND